MASSAYDAFWLSTASTARDSITLAGGILSFLSCGFTCVVIFRQRSYYMNAVNYGIVASIVFGWLGSLNFITAAAIRLAAPTSMRYFCDVSAIATELTIIPQNICEGSFFATMLRELSNGGANDCSYPKRCIAAALLFGIMISSISYSLLPVDPVWGTRYSGVGATWCFLPPSDSVNHQSPMYDTLQLFFGYMPFFVSAVLGLYCYFYVVRLWWLIREMISRRRRRHGADDNDREPFSPEGLLVAAIPAALRWRLLYFVAFLLTETVGAIHRYDHDLSSSPNAPLTLLQATFQPFLSTATALIFLASEGVVTPSSPSNIGAVRDLESLVVAPPSETTALLGGDGGPSTTRGGDRASVSNERPRLAGFGSESGTVREAIVSLYKEGLRHRSRQRPKPVATSRGDERAAAVNDDADASDRNNTFVGVPNTSVLIAEQRVEELFDTLSTMRVPQVRKPALDVMLSFVAGYCDTAGFVTMQLFTAHVTGNFATIGMSLIHRSPDLVLKFGGLVVFVVMIAACVQIKAWMGTRSSHPLAVATTPLWTAPRVFVVLQVALLLCSCLSNSLAGPVGTPSSSASHPLAQYLVGWTMVAAMSIQNAFQRFFLTGLPMTTLMTGNTVGVVVDVLLLRSSSSGGGGSAALTAEQRAPVTARVRNASLSIVAFVSGCAGATASAAYVPELTFVLPPIAMLLILAMCWDELA